MKLLIVAFTAASLSWSTASTAQPATAPASDSATASGATTATGASNSAADPATPQNSAQPAATGETATAPRLTGRHASGKFSGEIDSAQQDGTSLTVSVLFRNGAPGEGISFTRMYREGEAYEAIYLVAGDKKYMLLKDSNDVPLTPADLIVEGKGDIVGTWYGVFPAPPEGVAITLYMPDLQPIGPFKLSDLRN